jgi:hypothetical protein
MSADIINLKFSNQNISVNNLGEYLDKMLEKIGIKDDNVKYKIKNRFTKYSNETFKLIDINRQSIEQLLKANEDLDEIIRTDDFKDNTNFKQLWSELMEQFVILQGLIIIRKTTKDISKGMEQIIKALEAKLKAANALIQQELVD